MEIPARISIEIDRERFLYFSKGLIKNISIFHAILKKSASQHQNIVNRANKDCKLLLLPENSIFYFFFDQVLRLSYGNPCVYTLLVSLYKNYLNLIIFLKKCCSLRLNNKDKLTYTYTYYEILWQKTCSLCFDYSR